MEEKKPARITMAKEPLDVRIRSESPTSSSIKKRQFEHRIELEDREYNDHWKSCCLVMDRRAMMFFTQLLISLILMGLCVFELGNGGHTCERDTVYISILSAITSYWLPAPRI